ncbi:hypothetical protein Gpo141_00002673 [Globisporangium polare]
MSFCATKGFLKWRYFQARMKQKALDTLAKHQMHVTSPQVAIAYGDWSRRDGISGHVPSLVKGFKEALHKRATAIDQDKYRASKLCSGYH